MVSPGSLSQWKPADVGDGKTPKGVAIVGVTEHIEITSSPYHIYHEQLLFGEKHYTRHKSQSGLNRHMFFVQCILDSGVWTQKWSQLPLLYRERSCPIPLLDQILLKVCRDG